MKRPVAILGSAAFLALAPGTVAVLVPWWISRWHIQPPLLGWTAFRVVGALLVLAGLPVLLDSFARFALQGLGTPAPVVPTEHLVVSGLYRYVSVCGFSSSAAGESADWRFTTKSGRAFLEQVGQSHAAQLAAA